MFRTVGRSPNWTCPPKSGRIFFVPISKSQRLRFATMMLIAITGFVGCGGSSPSSPSSAASTVTSTTDLPPQSISTSESLPAGVVTTVGQMLLAQATYQGVHWFLSEHNDATMGTCRALDTSPPLITAKIRSAGFPFVLGRNKFECSRSELKLPSDDQPTSDTSAIDIVALDRGVNDEFSVVAGVTAPGVQTVTFAFPTGTKVTLRPSLSDTFVLISRPARPDPKSFSAQWQGGGITCSGPIDAGSNVGCTRAT